MTDFRDRLDEGAKYRDQARRQAVDDLAKLAPPNHPLAAVAYWDCLREEFADPVQEAVAAAREAGHPWAEIAGALNTSTESARNRHKYYLDRRD
jgi:hypothetical protein